MNLKKIAYLTLSLISLSFMYKVIGETDVSNNFFKIAELHLESC